MSSRLLQILDERMNIEEFRALCFGIHIQYENLAGDSKIAKMRECIEYLERRNSLPTLIQWLQQHRTDIQLSEDVIPTQTLKPAGGSHLLPTGQTDLQTHEHTSPIQPPGPTASAALVQNQLEPPVSGLQSQPETLGHVIRSAHSERSNHKRTPPLTSPRVLLPPVPVLSSSDNLKWNILAICIGFILQFLAITTINRGHFLGDFLIEIIDRSAPLFTSVCFLLGLAPFLLINLFRKYTLSTKQIAFQIIVPLQIAAILIFLLISDRQWWCNASTPTFSAKSHDELHISPKEWSISAPVGSSLNISIISENNSKYLKCLFSRSKSEIFDQLNPESCQITYHTSEELGVITVAARQIGCEPDNRTLFIHPLER